MLCSDPAVATKILVEKYWLKILVAQVGLEPNFHWLMRPVGKPFPSIAL